MKLNPDYIAQEIDDALFLVPVGAVSFNGMLRCNQTTAFIVDIMKEETTVDAILDAMCGEFDAPRSLMESDLGEALDILRSVNAIIE